MTILYKGKPVLMRQPKININDKWVTYLDGEHVDSEKVYEVAMLTATGNVYEIIHTIVDLAAMSSHITFDLKDAFNLHGISSTEIIKSMEAE